MVHRVVVQCLHLDLGGDGYWPCQWVSPTHPQCRGNVLGVPQSCLHMLPLSFSYVVWQQYSKFPWVVRPITCSHTYYLTGLWILAQWDRQEDQNCVKLNKGSQRRRSDLPAQDHAGHRGESSVELFWVYHYQVLFLSLCLFFLGLCSGSSSLALLLHRSLIFLVF